MEDTSCATLNEHELVNIAPAEESIDAEQKLVDTIRYSEEEEMNTDDVVITRTICRDAMTYVI